MSEPYHLDAKGLKCPLPVLRARKTMKNVPEGGILVVEATDPSASADFRAFCETTGHTLIEETQSDGVITIRLQKSG